MIRTRKTITLKSGASLLIRAPTQFDNVAVGEPPAAMMKRAKARKTEPPGEEDATPLTQPEIEYNVRVARTLLARCTGPLRLPDGTELRIVDKPFHLCTDAEVGIDEMEDDDAQEILAAISTLRKEAANAVKPFPAAAPQTPGEPASAGGDLRDSAQPPAPSDGRGD